MEAEAWRTLENLVGLQLSWSFHSFRLMRWTLLGCNQSKSLREPGRFLPCVLTHRVRKIIGKQAHVKNSVKKQFPRFILICVQIESVPFIYGIVLEQSFQNQNQT